MLEFLVDLIGTVIMTVYGVTAVYLLVHDRDYKDLMSGIVGFLFSAFILFVRYKNNAPHLHWFILIGLIIGFTLWVTGAYGRCMRKKG